MNENFVPVNPRLNINNDQTYKRNTNYVDKNPEIDILGANITTKEELDEQKKLQFSNNNKQSIWTTTTFIIILVVIVVILVIMIIFMVFRNHNPDTKLYHRHPRMHNPAYQYNYQQDISDNHSHGKYGEIQKENNSHNRKSDITHMATIDDIENIINSGQESSTIIEEVDNDSSSENDNSVIIDTNDEYNTNDEFNDVDIFDIDIPQDNLEEEQLKIIQNK